MAINKDCEVIFLGIITFIIVCLGAVMLFIALLIWYYYHTSKSSMLMQQIKAHKSVIRISEKDFSFAKIKELDIMLSNNGYLFDASETVASGTVIHVYRRT